MLPQLGLMEMLVVMGVAVLLFGKRLPEVGRSLGKGIIEFKKGLRGIEEDFTDSAGSSFSPRRSEERRYSAAAESSEGSVPKFEPPAAAAVPQMEYTPQPTQD